MWWKEAVGYQIYIKSFFDGNNDGIGDLKGITQKLDYLNDLGVNLIWITPFYQSPMDDNGYDISNFLNVDPTFGNLDDFKNLLTKAKKLKIKVIIDFVLNHTSNLHPWFIESRSSTNNPYRDYYIWQPGKNIKGKLFPPNNWGSFFGGSAWKFDDKTNEFYLKIFSDKMPDLNWENPKVIEEIIKVGKYWLDLGVDGFRMDAISHLEKSKYDDNTAGLPPTLNWHKFSNLPKVHHYIKILNEKLFAPYQAFTIGEVGGEASINEAKKYSGVDRKELNMVFNFDHNWHNNIHQINDLKDLKVNVKNLKETLATWQLEFLEIGWLPLNWLNHDQPRLVSHYGNPLYHEKSAKMLATLMYLQRGTPFIYQGEEIGMTNFPFEKIEQFDDISTINRYNELIKENTNQHEALKKVALTSRDHPRTAMQWSQFKNAGFTKVKPRVLINPNYISINVSNQLANDDSILNYYKKIIHLRRFSKRKDIILYGDYQVIDFNNDNIISYLRNYQQQKMIVVTSFSDKEIKININNYQIKEILINNYQKLLIEKNDLILKPYQAVCYTLKESNNA